MRNPVQNRMSFAVLFVGGRCATKPRHTASAYAGAAMRAYNETGGIIVLHGSEQCRHTGVRYSLAW